MTNKLAFAFPLIQSLDRPNPKLLPLLFAADTAKALGAKKITLIAPYLAYMRQDKQFHTGEGITSQYFASLLSQHFDALITIDPHLHRWHALKEIYTIPAYALHATQPIAAWIKQTISNPVLIGPDSESKQWVDDIASVINAPYLILQKERKGDTEVSVSLPQVDQYLHHTPVLVDDIISSGVTMAETIRHLLSLKLRAPICVGVHAVFADQAYQNLLTAGADQVVTCNTITHPSNRIDISQLLVDSLSRPAI